jgi:DNA-directed RNA polymerase subunit H (RpoH/RPB5)
MNKYYKIKGYEDYFITKNGKIFSTLTNKELKYDRSCRGYCKVKLMDRRLGKFITLQVHRLVAIQFIPNPRNLPEVNHKDGNHSNNSIYNLEWCTSEYNHRHAVENNLYKMEDDSPRAKLTKEQVIQIYKDYEICKTKTILAKKYNVSDALIGEIVRGVRWSRTYKEYYGEESKYKKPKRKKLSIEDLKSIVYKYFIEGKNTAQIQKETGVTNGYVSKIVRGIVYPKQVNIALLEIKKELENQQPNL